MNITMLVKDTKEKGEKYISGNSNTKKLSYGLHYDDGFLKTSPPTDEVSR